MQFLTTFFSAENSFAPKPRFAIKIYGCPFYRFIGNTTLKVLLDCSYYTSKIVFSSIKLLIHFKCLFSPSSELYNYLVFKTIVNWNDHNVQTASSKINCFVHYDLFVKTACILRPAISRVLLSYAKLNLTPTNKTSKMITFGGRISK